MSVRIALFCGGRGSATIIRALLRRTDVELTLLVTLINTWNRLNIAGQPEVGGYKPGMFD